MCARAKDPPRRRRRSRLRRWLRGLVLLGLGFIGAGLLGFWVLDLTMEARLPRIQSVAEYEERAIQMSRVYAADGSLLGEFAVERRSLALGRDIPRHVKLAAVAAEDGGFYHHEGLDFLGMLRALWVNVRDGRFSQGASTITQQVARTFYLSAEKTLSRKFEEVFLARKLDRHLSKDDILVLYLNQIYVGHGRYGIVEASRYYLGKEIGALTVGDAALLMALVPAPERLNPFDDLEACLKRRARILDDMARLEFVSRAEAEQAKHTRPRLARPRGSVARAPWFLDAVRRRVEAAVGSDTLWRGGLEIYTTLRPRAQAAADAAVAHADVPEGAEVALVMMEPRSREVLAMVGGRDRERSKFNRALQAHRQAGSTFKPVIYGAGLESGVLTPATEYPNKRIRFRGAHGAWRPSNADGVHDGRQVPVAEALARSLNVVAVQAARDVGVASATDFARRLGFEGHVPADLSMSLGNVAVTPLELTNAYATLASEGLSGRPVFVRRVEDARGRVLYAESAQARVAVSGEVCRTLTRMLEAVVREGTGRAAALADVVVAGKTGTTDRNVDAWFVGFTPALVGAVWVGRDDAKPLHRASGGSTAAPIWRSAVSGWRDAAGTSAAQLTP